MNRPRALNRIKYGDKILKVVHYDAPLFRADKIRINIGVTANNDYKGAPMKYFTLDESELKAYTKYGMPYKKTWRPTQELVLIDILDLSTRNALAQIIGSESLDIAFPVINNRVSRISEEDTKEHDNNVLRSICSLKIVDGYIMRALTDNNGKYVFHSEVGLCPSAFNKLILENVTKNIVAPSVNSKKKRRTYSNNNNNNSRRVSRFSLNFNNKMNNRMNTTKKNRNRNSIGRTPIPFSIFN